MLYHSTPTNVNTYIHINLEYRTCLMNQFYLCIQTRKIMLMNSAEKKQRTFR